MEKPPTFKEALRASKRWADFCSVVSIVLVIALCSAAWWLGSARAADGETKLGMMIIAASVVIVASIWQAAAFVVAVLQSTRDGDIVAQPDTAGRSG